MAAGSIAREIHLLPPRGHRVRPLALTILTLAPFVFGALALLLGQDANWDLRNYHWYNAYAFLNDRYGQDLLPSQTPYFYNPILDVPFYWLGTHVSARVAAFVLGTVQGLNFILLFMLAHVSLIIPNPRHKVVVCSLLAALGMLGGGGIAQIGVTFYDNVTSLGLFASAMIVVRHFDKLMNGLWHRAVLLAAFAGFLAGLMMGLKLPSVIFCIGLCFSLLFVAGPIHRRFLISFTFGLGVLTGIAVSLGYWAWFLDTNFDSPLFPYFNDLFKSPYAPLTSARDTQFIPRNIHDFFLFPFIIADNPLRTGEIPWRDWRIPILYALLPLAVLVCLFFGRSTKGHGQMAVPNPARYLLWTAVISYAVWLVMFAIYRYVLPLEMIAPLLIVFAVGLLPLRIQTRSLLAAGVLLLIAVTIRPGNWTRLPHWLEHSVEAEIPALPDKTDAMVLMTGFEPFSHVVTLFPPSMSFVRLQSNFSSPDENKGINAILWERLKAHKGPFMLLAPSWQIDLARGALSYFGLTLLPQTCQKVTDRLYHTKLVLCDVKRT